jgi:aerobic-type carbon monoxide dehydrogenase small subunit (CoxS/CutS family)
LGGPVRIKPVVLTVNGCEHALELPARVTLAEALREQLGLTGTKVGCNRAECGSCTVLVDGKAVFACTMLAVEAGGRRIETIEGLARDGRLHPLQEAFIEHDALQCGICIPGMIMSVKALLDSHPHPTPEEIARGMEGNLCRCGAYSGILKAAQRAAELLRRRSENVQGRKDEERV